MKLRNKTKQWGSLLLAAWLIASSLVTVIVAINPQPALAESPSVPTSAATVATNNAIGCEAQISAPTTMANTLNTVGANSNLGNWIPLTNDWLGIADGGSIAQSSLSAADKADATKTLTPDSTNKAAITFTSQDSANKKSCASSLILFQSVNTSKPNTFYGYWDLGIGVPGAQSANFATPEWYFISAAYVAPPSGSGTVGTISFTLPAVSYTSLTTKEVSWPGIQVAGFTPAITSLFGSAPGNGTTASNCDLTAITTSADLQTCVGTQTTAGTLGSPAFTDAAHIVFDGDTYTASTWSGNGSSNVVKYLLTSSSNTSRQQDNTGGSGIPEIDLPVAACNPSGSATNSFNLCSDSGTDISNYLKTIKAGQTVNLKFTNYTLAGNPSGGSKATIYNVSTSGINIVANYYPASASSPTAAVISVFTGGGSNEGPYVGTYTQASSNSLTYTNASGGPQGCTTTRPSFVFTTDPSTITQTRDTGNSTVPTFTSATWNLPESPDCSTATSNGQVQVLIEPANTAQPVVKSPPAATTVTPTCESSGFTLAWIMCPVINGLASTVDGMYSVFIRPLLVTKPIDISNTNCTASDNYSGCDYAVWSNFRIYGDIFLVIALLVIVFGQSIGGGMIDAYTAKKILPRLLIAAILINLSIYIVAFAVDITNIIGNGIQTLITQPFNDAGAFHLGLTGPAAGTAGLGIAVPLLGAAGTIWAAIAAPAAALVVASAILPPLVMFLAVFILMPALFIFLAILATVLIRRGLIIFLVLISPVAFALYCLPNTEQYFKKWWDLLLKTLLVYPIIAVVFAISDVLSVTIEQGGKSSGMAAWVADLLALAALVLPLFLIPFSFRLAGGAIGKIHETLTNYHKRGQELIKGNINNPRSLRNRLKTNLQNGVVTGGSHSMDTLRGASKKQTGFRRRAAIGGMRALGVYDWDMARKDQNEHFDKEISGKVAMGADNLERAFFARQWTGPDRKYLDAAGNEQTLTSGRYYSTYKDSDGVYKESSAGDVKNSHRKYDGNESKIQTLIKYETGKVPNDEGFYGVDANGETIYNPAEINSRIDRNTMPMGSFLGNLPTVMKEAGLPSTSAAGASIGSFFATQAQHRELKHTRPDGNGGWVQDEHALVQDWAENVGSYAASNQKTAPINRLRQINKGLRAKQARIAAGQARVDEKTGQREVWTTTDERSSKDFVRIAQGLDSRMRYGGSGAQVGQTEGGDPISDRGSGGPGRVNEAISLLVKEVLGDGGDQAPRGGGGGGGGPRIIIPPSGYTGSQG